MDIPRRLKLTLKLATLVPFLWVVLLLGSSLVTSIVASTMRQPGMSAPAYVFFAVIALFPFVLIEMFALTVVYVLLVVRATPGNIGRRLPWLLAVVLLSVFGQAAFLFTVVSPRASVSPATPSTPNVAESDSFDGWS